MPYKTFGRRITSYYKRPHLAPHPKLNLTRLKHLSKTGLHTLAATSSPEQTSRWWGGANRLFGIPRPDSNPDNLTCATFSLGRCIQQVSGIYCTLALIRSCFLGSPTDKGRTNFSTEVRDCVDDAALFELAVK